MECNATQIIEIISALGWAVVGILVTYGVFVK